MKSIMNRRMSDSLFSETYSEHTYTSIYKDVPENFFVHAILDNNRMCYDPLLIDPLKMFDA